jgi:hypothetical protein
VGYMAKWLSVDKNKSIAELSNEARFHIIRTPVNSVFRSAKHIAILDCKTKMILEGVKDDKGYLLIDGPLYTGKTIEDYIKHRQSCQKFNFVQRHDIEIVSLRLTKQGYYKLLNAGVDDRDGDIALLQLRNLAEKAASRSAFLWPVRLLIEGLAKEDYDDLVDDRLSSYHPDENDMEERWDELENLPKRKYKYDYSRENGWNCESVVSYILAGLPYPSQGEKYAYLKNLGILDRHGNLFASCKRR